MIYAKNEAEKCAMAIRSGWRQELPAMRQTGLENTVRENILASPHADSRWLAGERPPPDVLWAEIAAIAAWQEKGEMHPLTCGKNSSHTPLLPALWEGRVVLVCVDCNYYQKWVPRVVVNAVALRAAAPQPPDGRVYVVELDNQLHTIFATQEAADAYCQSRRDPREYQLVKWRVLAK